MHPKTLGLSLAFASALLAACSSTPVTEEHTSENP